MLKSITKTIRVPQDFMVEEFLAKQKNFSAAVRYLIFCYCRDHQEGIEDLSEKYDRELQQTIYQMHGQGPVIPTPAPEPPPVTESIPTTLKTSRTPIGFTSMCATDIAVADTSRVPNCYR